MSEEKYYTPIIDEFRVWFVYEVKRNDSWTRTYINRKNPDISRIQAKIEDKKIRVKFLDIDDIENLIVTKIDPDGCFYFEDNDKNELCMSVSGRAIKIVDVEMNETRFSGQIKNRSELKVLLNQIHVKCI